MPNYPAIPRALLRTTRVLPGSIVCYVIMIGTLRYERSVFAIRPSFREVRS